MQQLTCNIDLSSYFSYLFLSFVLIELKTLCFEGQSPGGKILKKMPKVWKILKTSETILPFGCCPLVLLRGSGWEPLLASICCSSHI